MAKVTKNTKQDMSDVTVEEKLKALYDLQLVDSEIDKIKILRGELPLEVQDLEDEIAGLQTRLVKFEQEIKVLDEEVHIKKAAIVESNALIKKYEAQQMNVRNNREYDSLSKETEFQGLEIQLAEKRIREFSTKIEEVKQHIENSKAVLAEKENTLALKKAELDQIVAETQKEEEKLEKKSQKVEKIIEPRLLTAYKRIRDNALNGLAVVMIERDACGGCFNKIPPQRQLDIRTRKKIIVCEFCGRILVDASIMEIMEKVEKVEME
jgi:predicted  nucleic acid-binding Zn-ribbon protein